MTLILTIVVECCVLSHECISVMYIVYISSSLMQSVSWSKRAGGRGWGGVPSQGHSQKFLLGVWIFKTHCWTFLGRYNNVCIIRSITIKTSFLLHKNLPGLILGGYIYRYTPHCYGPVPSHWGKASKRCRVICIFVAKNYLWTQTGIRGGLIDTEGWLKM